jgi:hypothetical protein
MSKFWLHVTGFLLNHGKVTIFRKHQAKMVMRKVFQNHEKSFLNVIFVLVVDLKDGASV